LLTVVKRVAVKERPNKLPGNIFKGELETGMLKGRVMPGLIGAVGDGVPLKARDFSSLSTSAGKTTVGE
jgi:hypothetical protein